MFYVSKVKSKDARILIIPQYYLPTWHLLVQGNNGKH